MNARKQILGLDRFAILALILVAFGARAQDTFDHFSTGFELDERDSMSYPRWLSSI